MFSRGLRMGLATGLIMAGIGAASAFQGVKSPNANVPAAVQSAINEFFGASGNYEPMRKSLDGSACYVVTGSRDGEEISLVVAPTGDLQEVCRRISRSELPAAAQAKLRLNYPDLKFDTFETIDLHLFRVTAMDAQNRPVHIFAAGNRWEAGTAAPVESKPSN